MTAPQRSARTLGASMRLVLLPRADPSAFPSPLHPVGSEVVSLDEISDGADASIVLTDAAAPFSDQVDIVLQRVRQGARLLCFGLDDGPIAEAAGARVDEHLPAGEVFATCTGRSPLTARSVDEFSVAGSLATLQPTSPDVVVALTSSVRFSHRPALIERRCGRGTVVVSGFGIDAAEKSPELARIMRRALHPVERATGTLGVGVIGYGPHGGMGFLHGTASNETAGLGFVAAVDTDAQRRKTAENEFAGIATYSRVDDLLDDDAVDIVVVATPPSSHAALAGQVLAAGRHVVVEKPLCLTTVEADALLAAARDNDRFLTVHQNRRWDPDFLALRRAIDTGLVGNVFNIETFVGSFEHPCRAWHSEASVSGGAIYDWGSHHIDWILQLFGDDPATVVTSRHKRVWHDVTNDDQVRVRLGWDDGREAEFFHSDLAGVRRPKFYVQGTAGTVAGHYRPLVEESVEAGRGYRRHELHHAEAPADLVLARYEPGWGLTETTLPPLPAGPWPFHRNLADHLLSGEPPAVEAASARRVIGVLEAAERSGALGGAMLDLDPWLHG